MSCLVLDPKCFEYIKNGFEMAAHRSTCDEYYSDIVQGHIKKNNLDIHEEAIRLMKNWATLNEFSYTVAYKEESGESLIPFIDDNAIWTVNCWQLLSYLNCLIYNIEIETIQSGESYTRGSLANPPKLTDELKADYELLIDWRSSLANAILVNHKEYKSAKWSDAPVR